jgi:DNA (cytosine-5)-methyltransferase 1
MEKLKVGTDCSGIGAPEMALKRLGVEHEIEFACEFDKHARQTYLANWEPKQMFEDMTKRDMDSTPAVDLYVAGIPCQPFSLAGRRLGESDARGTLFFNFYEYVKKQQPKYVIIENVKVLLSI